MKNNFTPATPTLVERIASPTSKFFKKLRLIGIILSAAAGAILASPVVLPAAIVTAAGYALAASSTLIAVASVTTSKE